MKSLTLTKTLTQGYEEPGALLATITLFSTDSYSGNCFDHYVWDNQSKMLEFRMRHYELRKRLFNAFILMTTT